MEDTTDAPSTETTKERPPPPVIVYCGVCGLPPEYCEFGPNFEKCKPWLIQHCPDLYPQLKEGNESEKEQKSGTGKRGGKGIVKAENDSDVKIMPGGKVKVKQEKPLIHVSQVQRNKNKFVTVVSGLDKFGVKLSDASKLFGKKFACGASVVKNNNDEEINVQGDIIDDIIDFMHEKWNIDEDSIVIDDKKKGKK